MRNGERAAVSAGTSRTRATVLKFLVMALVACQQERCPTDASLDCLDMPCGVGPPRGPYVLITSPAGRTTWDTLRSGETLRLTASLRDSLGNPLAARGTMQWTSSDTGAATVSEMGIVSAKRTGLAIISARAVPENASGVITFEIVPGAVSTVTFMRSSGVIPAGESRTFVARARDAYGNDVRGSAERWSTSDTSIAVASSTGVVTGMAPGGPVLVRVDIGAQFAAAAVIVSRTMPVRVKAVALGRGHSCALTVDGVTYCWGGNAYGQLGDSTTVDRPTLAPVLQGSLRFAGIAAGGDHTCGRTAEGALYCWGGKDMGELGDGRFRVDRLAPDRPVLGSVRYGAVVAGGGHTCGLSDVGEVHCWGSHAYGQVGDGSGGSVIGAPVRVSVPGATVGKLAVGSAFSCALTSAGPLYCWGANSSGQLGDGSQLERRAPVLATRAPANVTSIATGGSHTCALGADGAVRCWGGFFDSRQGFARTFAGAEPPVGEQFGALVSPAGDGVQCAITVSGRPACWGTNVVGGLGDGTMIDAFDRAVLVRVGGDAVIGLAQGGQHACAWTSAGRVLCWGRNNLGQLGEGTFIDRPSPTPIRAP